MTERWMGFLIWLFRIDEGRSYEEQPQWVAVLFFGALLDPRVVALWGVLTIAAALWWWL
jgi:hypothetical protein